MLQKRKREEEESFTIEDLLDNSSSKKENLLELTIPEVQQANKRVKIEESIK